MGPRLSALVAAGLALVFMSAAGGAGAPAPVSAPTGQGLDPAFLELPAFDATVVPPAPDKSGKPTAVDGPLHVGDQLLMEIDGLSRLSPAGGATPEPDSLALAIPRGEKDPFDQGWEIQAPDPAKLPPNPEGRQGRLFFVLVPLKQGKLALSSLAIATKKDAQAVGRTNPLTMDVASSLPPGQPPQPAEPRPPVALAFPLWLAICLGILAASALGAAGYGILRWARARAARRRELALANAPRLPEDERALAALAELEKQGRIQKGEFKPHYFRASEIVKNYLGERFDCDAPEMTAREILAALEKRGDVADEILDRLESLFQKLDLVKFTDAVPSPTDAGTIVPEARSLVQKTRRVPAIAAPGAAPGASGPATGHAPGRR